MNDAVSCQLPQWVTAANPLGRKCTRHMPRIIPATDGGGGGKL